jgi:hypothetical protein
MDLSLASTQCSSTLSGCVTLFLLFVHHSDCFQPDIPVEPAPIPLPCDEDQNDASVSVPVASGSHRPATKVAGSRWKTKEPINKENKKADETTKSSKCGRPSSAANFSNHDIWALLNAVEAELPLGERGWKAIQAVYNKYAQECGHALQSLKSLETKYKQVRLVPCVHTLTTD